MPRLRPVAAPITIELDGEPLEACDGETVAAALLGNGVTLFSRSPKYHRPRGAFCLTGACAHCLMRIDGVPNLPACRVRAKQGMVLERQNAVPDARLDLLRANDFVFREWFNHHEFLAGVPVVEHILLRIARQLAGLGVLPARPAPARVPATRETHGLVIVGRGVAGRAAAQHFTKHGAPFLLLERNDGDEVVGLYVDDGVPFLISLSLRSGERAGERGPALRVIHFKQLLLANGGHPALPAFPNNDLPGVMAGSAVAQLISEGVLPGKRIACTGDEAEARALAQLVTESGGSSIVIAGTVARAHGLRRVTAVTAESGEKIPCDVIAVCAPHTPAFELARAAGAELMWNEEHRCFVPVTDAAGKIQAGNIFISGTARAPVSEDEAARQGLAAAEAMLVHE